MTLGEKMGLIILFAAANIFILEGWTADLLWFVFWFAGAILFLLCGKQEVTTADRNCAN